MNLPEQDTVVRPESRSPDLRSQLGRLALLIGSEGLSRGALAELRRMDPDQPRAATLFKLLAETGVDLETLSPDALRRWALVAQAMAIMAPHHHSPSCRTGTALHDAAIAEARVARFLNATQAQFRALVIRLARQLKARGQPIDWRELGALVMAEARDGDWAEGLRMRIARDFYAAEARNATTGARS